MFLKTAERYCRKCEMLKPIKPEFLTENKSYEILWEWTNDLLNLTSKRKMMTLISLFDSHQNSHMFPILVYENVAQLITCRSECVSVRGQSSQGKRSGSISVDRWDIQDNGHASRDGSARGVKEQEWGTSGKTERQRGGRGYRQNEWRVFNDKIRDVFALLNGVEKKSGEEFAEVMTEVVSPMWASRRRKKKNQSSGTKWGTEEVKGEGKLQGKSCGKEKREVCQY